MFVDLSIEIGSDIDDVHSHGVRPSNIRNRNSQSTAKQRINVFALEHSREPRFDYPARLRDKAVEIIGEFVSSKEIRANSIGMVLPIHSSAMVSNR